MLINVQYLGWSLSDPDACSVLLANSKAERVKQKASIYAYKSTTVPNDFTTATKLV